MVAINEILLPEYTGEGCGGEIGTCPDSRVHRRNAENRAPATRNHRSAPILGRWMEQDPAQYINGANTYQFVDSSPVGNVDAVGLVTFPNNSEKGGGTFSVHLSPTGNGGSLWDTAVDVEFMPSKQHGCKFNQIKLIQFVRARYRVSGSAHGWKLENGVPSGLLELFDSARYYQGQALFYANQTAMLPDVLPWAESWDQPGRNRSSVSEEEWKVYAVCFGSNGAVHSFGYVSYGIDDYDRATDSPTDAISYWVAGGGASIGAPGKTPAMNVTGIAPLPGGIAP
jgi:hypothetical protein